MAGDLRDLHRAYNIEFKSEIYRIPIDNPFNSVSQLVKIIKKRFKIAPDTPIRLKYLNAVLDNDDSLYDLQIDASERPIRVSVPNLEPEPIVSIFELMDVSMNPRHLS